MSKEAIGKIGKQVKLSAGLFWSDYGYLADTVRELEEGGADWVHLEMRDGVYMNFDVPRGGIDILTGIRPHTDLEIEVQLQMMRPTHQLFKQLADEGASLISLPIETTGETLIQSITYIRETLELKAGVWAWQGTPLVAFEQYIPFVDIIEYESRAPFWKPAKAGKSPHTLDPIMEENIERLHRMLVERGRDKEVDLMEDGGLNAENLEPFVRGGMTVGEFSSPVMKGPEGKLKPGSGKIKEATRNLKKVLTDLSEKYRKDDGSLKG